MPLAFSSITHGRIAFGFFNIDTDLLLLENLFFFAPEFCGLMERLAGDSPSREEALPGWIIPDRSRIGDLHGAIAGTRLSGFIGAVYRLYPFPRDPAGFKQQPEGDRNRPRVEELLGEWAEGMAIPVGITPEGDVSLGGIGFSPEGSGELVEYVWQGGMPRWREMKRPDYVERMGRRLSRVGEGLFAGLNLV